MGIQSTFKNKIKKKFTIYFSISCFYLFLSIFFIFILFGIYFGQHKMWLQWKPHTRKSIEHWAMNLNCIRIEGRSVSNIGYQVKGKSLRKIVIFLDIKKIFFYFYFKWKKKKRKFVFSPRFSIRFEREWKTILFCVCVELPLF